MDGERRTLREWRTLRYMNQDQLATATGLSQFTISQIELGKSSPRPSTLKRLCEALNIRPEQLIFEPPKQRQRRKPERAKTEAEERAAA